jgi:sec-independent protein translocase protein TatA
MFAFLPGLGMQEILLLLLLGVLLFGRKLPDIGRSLGKTVVEFKKGVKGLEDEVSGEGQVPRQAIEPEPVRPPQRITASAPKFEDAPATNLPPKV